MSNYEAALFAANGVLWLVVLIMQRRTRGNEREIRRRAIAMCDELEASLALSRDIVKMAKVFRPVAPAEYEAWLEGVDARLADYQAYTRALRQGGATSF